MNAQDEHPAVWEIDRLLVECRIKRTRGSGPGGQHRNKVETAIVITHEPSGVQGAASERRSQEANRQQALLRLRVNLAIEVRRERAADQPPSPLWQSRCRGGRLTVNPRHEDYPALLAEALDACETHVFDIAAAAAALAITSSQLSKLLKLAPRAWEQINQQRRQRGLRPLR